MKKIFILFIPFILTGCINSSGVLTSTCTRTLENNMLKEEDVYSFTYYEGNIEKLDITRTYSINIENTLLTEKLIYESYEGVKIDVSSNSIHYDFDLSKIDNEIKEKFDILDTYQKQVNKLEEKGFTCK